MTKEQAQKSGLKPVNGRAGWKKVVAEADGPLVSAIVRYIRKGGDIYLRTTTVRMQDMEMREFAGAGLRDNNGRSAEGF